MFKLLLKLAALLGIGQKVEAPKPPPPVEPSVEPPVKPPVKRLSPVDRIKAECLVQDLELPEQIAYVLATVEWETAGTFKPVKEAYWLSENWRRKNLRYYPYYGRGYVQLTWESNYRKYSKILGIDLVENPDKALEHGIALFILVHGFKHGTFTGKKITNYINKDKVDFYNARRCINGTDKAARIAALAEKHLENL